MQPHSAITWSPSDSLHCIQWLAQSLCQEVSFKFMGILSCTTSLSIIFQCWTSTRQWNVGLYLFPVKKGRCLCLSRQARICKSAGSQRSKRLQKLCRIAKGDGKPLILVCEGYVRRSQLSTLLLGHGLLSHHLLPSQDQPLEPTPISTYVTACVPSPTCIALLQGTKASYAMNILPNHNTA